MTFLWIFLGEKHGKGKLNPFRKVCNMLQCWKAIFGCFWGSAHLLPFWGENETFFINFKEFAGSFISSFVDIKYYFQNGSNFWVLKSINCCTWSEPVTLTSKKLFETLSPKREGVWKLWHNFWVSYEDHLLNIESFSTTSYY